MEIRFSDASTEQLFSARELLEARYGAVLSKKIMLRIAVLQAASTLAAIPTRAPFNLRKFAKSEYVIDLIRPNALHLACEPASARHARLIRTIRILGVIDAAD